MKRFTDSDGQREAGVVLPELIAVGVELEGDLSIVLSALAID